MINPFDELRAALEQARALNRAVDSQCNALVDLLEGRLRKASPCRLARLKRELRDYNIHTGRWNT